MGARPAGPLLKHRCAVCWERLPVHEQWFDHIIEQHGASIESFGITREACWGAPRDDIHCPGILHADNLAAEGKPPVRRTRPYPQAFRARDGTVYTPQELWREP